MQIDLNVAGWTYTKLFYVRNPDDKSTDYQMVLILFQVAALGFVYLISCPDRIWNTRILLSKWYHGLFPRGESEWAWILLLSTV
jgi:hypothetical protein